MASHASHEMKLPTIAISVTVALCLAGCIRPPADASLHAGDSGIARFPQVLRAKIIIMEAGGGSKAYLHLQNFTNRYFHINVDTIKINSEKDGNIARNLFGVEWHDLVDGGRLVIVLSPADRIDSSSTIRLDGLLLKNENTETLILSFEDVSGIKVSCTWERSECRNGTWKDVYQAEGGNGHRSIQ